MAITITPSSTFYTTGSGLWTDVESFFPAFEAHFDVADHSAHPGAFAGPAGGQVITNINPYGIPGLPAFSGTQYALQGEDASSIDLGFIVQAASGSYLNYSFMGGVSGVSDHTLYGQIGSITFGSGLTLNSVTNTYSFTENLLTISGLDTGTLNGGLDSTGAVIGRNHATLENDTHNIVNGLMGGDTTALLEALANNDLLTAEVAAFFGDVGLVGVAANSDADFALAA